MNKLLDKYIYADAGLEPTASDNAAIKEFQQIASKYCAAENQGNRLRIHLILRNQALVNTLRRLPLEKELAENIELYAYTQEDWWSMEVLGIRLGTKTLLDRMPIKTDSNSRVHLVLFGTSAQAESLAIHTALIAHYPNYSRNNWLRTRITWIGDEMNDFIRFKCQYRNLLENSYRRDVVVNSNGDVKVETSLPKYVNERKDFIDIEWEFVECKGYSDIISYKLYKWADDEEQQLTIAYCYDNDDRNINEALNCTVKEHPVPILLRVKDDTSVQLLKKSSSYKQLIPIGMEGRDLQNPGDFIRMAQYVNFAYCHMRDSSEVEKEQGATDMVVATELPTEEELQRLWNNPKLTTSKRWSNIYNAFSLNTKLHSMGISADECMTLFAINEKDIETMAEVEHNRWSVEELILGYVPTTMEEHRSILSDIRKRNEYKTKFKHDDLRNYSELGVDDSGLSVVRYDIGLTRTIPLIAYANYIFRSTDKTAGE